MKAIYKYRLQPATTSFVSMPAGARLLHVGDQFGDLLVWALVDGSAPWEAREFRVLGTGHPADNLDGFSHLGTVQQNGGMLVWHIFVKGAP